MAVFYCLARVSHHNHDLIIIHVQFLPELSLSRSSLEQLARKFKQRFGTGGTVAEFMIEIQGDHCDDIRQELLKQGYNGKMNQERK